MSAGDGWESSQGVERGAELVGPGPAGWEPQGGAAGSGDEPAGYAQEPVPESLGDDEFVAAAGAAEGGGPADEVVGEHGALQPGAVGVERAGGQVGERPGFEIPDRQLDHGMRAVLAIECPRRAGEVGDERVVAPGGEQLALGAVVVANSAHDQAPTAVDALGDVRFAVGVVDALPRALGDGV